MNQVKLLFVSFLFILISGLSIVAQNTSAIKIKNTSSSNIKTIDLTVDGMTCQMGCANGIDKKLKAVTGVVKSKTKLNTSTSTITYDETIIKIPQLIAIIEDRGYKAKVSEKNKTM